MYLGESGVVLSCGLSWNPGRCDIITMCGIYSYNDWCRFTPGNIYKQIANKWQVKRMIGGSSNNNNNSSRRRRISVFFG
jgi:hypothetical protein